MGWWPWQRGPAEDDLRTRVAALESDNRRIRAEWADILDRLLRLDERQRKRQERSETPPESSESPARKKALLRLRAGLNGTRQ